MSNIIDSIKLSGVTYTIQGSGGGGNPTVEVTQAEYDAMVTAGTVSADTYYIITDAQAGDLTNYYTKTETDTLLGGKADTATTYTKTEVDNAITAATSTKQDTLVSGTNIKTINNESILGSGNIDIQGGGGGVDVVQTTGTSTTDVMSQNAVTTQLSGYVTTDTEQDITGNKTFTGGINTNEKPIIFKQVNNSHKIGFVCRNSAATNNEVASFEFRPNTFTIDNVQHPLLYFGHYRNTQTANAGVPQTVIGFRQYDQLNAAAYHYLMPLPEKAKTPFSLTTSFKDYYAPMGFKNGSTMITADNTGVVDLSSELGGLKLKKLTQAEYDALSGNTDANTLYVIVNPSWHVIPSGSTISTLKGSKIRVSSSVLANDSDNVAFGTTSDNVYALANIGFMGGWTEWQTWTSGTSTPASVQTITQVDGYYEIDFGEELNGFGSYTDSSATTTTDVAPFEFEIYY